MVNLRWVHIHKIDMMIKRQVNPCLFRFNYIKARQKRLSSILRKNKLKEQLKWLLSLRKHI
jgi:hypothetical protein